MTDVAADETGSPPRWTTIGTGWAVAVGVSMLGISVFTLVLVPIVAALVAAWWLATDARSTGSRTPGALGKAALVVLAVAWALTAWVVVGFDAHFDCGGTLGGFGESASARLDEACYDRRFLRVPLAVLVVIVGSIGAGVWLRRRARAGRPGVDRVRLRSPGAASAAAVGACVLGWSAVIVLLVAS